MLLTLSTTHQPATDLGFLLFKHPERAQTFDVSAGKAHVFYPEASKERCTAALVLEADPVKLVRGNQGVGGEKWTLDQYVNDRPYVASSFMSVTLSEVYGTALSGRSDDRPELAETALPFEVHLSAVPSPDDGRLIHDLFEPLGYDVQAEPIPLDNQYSAWGPSPYFQVDLAGEQVLADLLSHIYILMPVLDGDKHYFVDQDEVDKLVRKADGWLDGHPEQSTIVRRYLKSQEELIEAAYDELGEPPSPETTEPTTVGRDGKKLDEDRLDTVADIIRRNGPKRVVDLGCGEGKLIERLTPTERIDEILGIDVSWNALKRAARRLGLTNWPDIQGETVALQQGSLVYRDERINGFDAAALVEVIEHLDTSKLDTLERVVFEFAQPSLVVVTTPNREFNQTIEFMEPSSTRHHDHRFEWDRDEFQNWADAVADSHGYSVEYRGIGIEKDAVGHPTQMGIFTR
jgi:3' terminal RNA ribose 2'-O-methyltransferase Hen1